MYRVSTKFDRVTWGTYKKFVKLARNDPNTKPTRLHCNIVLFIIPIKQAKEFMYNTSITQLILSSFL